MSSGAMNVSNTCVAEPRFKDDLGVGSYRPFPGVMGLMSGGGALSASPRGVRGVLGTSYIEAMLRAFFKSRALDFGVGD